MTEATVVSPSAGWAHRSGLVDLALHGAHALALTSGDRDCIAEMFARYAIAYDERRFDVLESVFAPAAVYEARIGDQVMAVFNGRAAIVAGIQSVTAEQGDDQRRHLIGNLVLDVIGPCEVLATAYALVTVIATGEVSVQASAIYRAELAKRENTWAFTKIVVGMDGYLGPAPRR